MRVKLIHILVFLLLTNISIIASEAQYVFHHIGIQNGLADSYVRAVMRDKNNFMWFGTMNGLNRFDGYSCRLYPVTDMSGQTDVNISRVAQDFDGTIWITSLAGNLYYYDSQLDIIDNNSSAKLLNLGINTNGRQARVFIDDEHNLWCASGNTIHFYSFPQRHLYKIKTKRIPVQITSDGYRNYALYPNGDIEEIAVTNGKTRLVGRININGATDLMMHQQGDEYLWVYDSYIAGLYRIDMKNGCRIDKILDTNVTAMESDSEGNLWIGTNSEGVMMFDSSLKCKAVMRKQPDNPFSIPTNHIKTLYLDKENILWIGTSKSGVAYTSSERSNVTMVRTPFLEDISCFADDESNRLLIGYDGTGLAVESEKGETIKPYKTNNGQLKSNLIIGTYKEKDGSILLGSYGGGIMHMKNGNITIPEWAGNPDLQYAQHIVRDGQDNLWIGSPRTGLVCLDRNCKATTYTYSNSALNTNAITGLCYSKKQNTLYIATSTGLCLIQGNGKITQAASKNKEVNLARIEITTILAADNGLIYIGTRGSMYVFSHELELLDKIDASGKKAQVRAITTDRKGNVWFTTDNQIVQITPVSKNGKWTFPYHLYSASSGIGNMTFTKYAIYCNYAGDILAGGNGAFIRISPSYKWMEEKQGKVVFSRIYINNEPAGTDTSRLELKWNDNLTVEVSALDYINIDNIRYKYRLGDNEPWIEADGNRIHLSHLSTGSYQLQVCIDNGGRKGDISIMEVRICPPAWRSWWMIAIYMILLLAAGIQIWRVMSERQKSRHRTMQLMNENAQQRKLAKAKMQFLTNISHDLRTPLALIINPVEQILNSGRYKDIQDTLNMILRNARQLLDQVNELLDIRSMENDKEEINLTHTDLTEFLSEICTPYKLVAESNNVQLNINEAKPHINTAFDKDKLKRVIINLLSNAIKYNQKDGIVEISASECDEAVVIRVADTGIGIKHDNRERIFERFFQENQTDSSLTGNGIGLHIVKEYVNLMEGSIEVTDNQPCGSIFTIKLPKKAEAGKPYQPTADNEREKKTILVVEDNNDFRKLIMSMLESDYSLIDASNGKEALDILHTQKVDLILSDVMMPVMDGMQLCHNVKTDINLSHIPIILLTARTAEEHIISGYREGADDYITKPFNTDILKIRVRKIIDRVDDTFDRLKKPETATEDIGISRIDKEFIKKAKEVVEMNMSIVDFSVEDFSTAMNMSRSTLYKKLHGITGHSPLEFMRIIKMRRGYQLLKAQGGNISEVAYKVGLSPKQFSKYFKETYGVLPSQINAEHFPKQENLPIDV